MLGLQQSNNNSDEINQKTRYRGIGGSAIKIFCNMMKFEHSMIYTVKYSHNLDNEENRGGIEGNVYI